jgi:ferrochelatase
MVEWAMRYGQPSIPDKLQALKDAGCDRIVLFPLYPQYAAATTATVNDKAFQAMMDMRWQPALRTVPPYHDDPAYIEAIAQSIETHLAGLDWEPEWCSPRSTAFRSPISSRATPIIASA